MRRVYEKILVGVTKKGMPKYVKGILLFTCIDASDITDKLQTLGLSRLEVSIFKSK